MDCDSSNSGFINLGNANGQVNEIILKMDETSSATCDDDLNPPITFTNDDGQTIFVKLEDSVISDQEISVTDSTGGEDKLLLVTTVGEISDTAGDCTASLTPSVVENSNIIEKEEEHISQNWFTSKTDKQTFQEKGHRWKQGQWTAEENEILKQNIRIYCQEKGIKDANSIIFDMAKDRRKDFYRQIARGLDRPLFSVYRRVLRMYDQKNHIGRYTPEELAKLRELREKHGNDWSTIGAALGRSAGSVRDRCRLLKDSCRYGTWQHDEEMRLANAVYELSGAQPGEEVHHGLCWADVAAKVKTRTDKQCRAKWLNFLNWKQKGGTEWAGPADDLLLLDKIIGSGVYEESEVDWVELSKGWTCVRSPQWLRSKWWMLKRHVPGYQRLPFVEILTALKDQSLVAGGRLGPQLSLTGSVTGVEASADKAPPATFRLCNSENGYRLTPTVQLPDGTHAILSDELSLDTSSLLISSNSNTFLIANPHDTISFPLSSMNESLVVQAASPMNEQLVVGGVSGLDTPIKADAAGGNELVESRSVEDNDIILLDEPHTTSHTADTILVHESSSKPSLHLSSLSDPLLNGQPSSIVPDH